MKDGDGSVDILKLHGGNTRRVLSIPEFCDSYGIRRTKAYQEINAGRLEVVKAGRRSLIPLASAEAWLAGLRRLGEK